jgi:hypothetical protein
MEEFDYQKYKEDKIEKAIKDKLEENIFLKQDKVMINKRFYDVKKKNEKKKIPVDDRFKRMFTDKDFEIEEDDK